MAVLSAEVVGSNPERLSEFVKVQVERWTRVIKPGMRMD
jgi:hypothetical protein